MIGFLKKLFGFADVNKDGKVNATDAKIVAQNVETAAAKVKAKAKNSVTKAKIARARKSKPQA